MRRTLLLLPLVSIGLSSLCEARDRPGTPTDVQVTAQSPTRVALNWRNTARKDQNVRYEVEFTKNGAPSAVPQPEGTSGTGESWLGRGGYVVGDLEAEARHCARVWSRFVDNDVRSAQPSAWACAETPAVPPLPPLDVVAMLAGNGKLAHLQWNSPDQSRHRRITRFEIERQSPPGPNRPTLIEGSVAGPDGEQSVKTKLAFSVKSGELNPALKHAFRVCAINSGGRTCAAPVVATSASINVHNVDKQPLAGQAGVAREPKASATSALAPVPLVLPPKTQPGWSPTQKTLNPQPLPPEPPPDKRLRIDSNFPGSALRSQLPVGSSLGGAGKVGAGATAP